MILFAQQVHGSEDENRVCFTVDLPQRQWMPGVGGRNRSEQKEIQQNQFTHKTPNECLFRYRRRPEVPAADRLPADHQRRLVRCRA